MQILQLRATGLEGERLLHVLAAVHAEAPKRLLSAEVADAGKALKGCPLEIVTALKPHQQ